MLLNESYFNDHSDSDVNINDVTLIISEYHILHVITYNNISIGEPAETKLTKKILYMCERSMIFDSYDVNIKYIPDSDVTYDITIKFICVPHISLSMFTKFIFRLLSFIHQFIRDNDTAINQEDIYVSIDDSETRRFDKLSNNNKEIVDLFSKISKSAVMLRSLKTIEYCFNYSELISHDEKNMSNVKVGDILYSTKDKRLVLSPTTDGKENIPIGIAIENYNSNEIVRFMSLRYLSYAYPSKGSLRPTGIFFGNKGGSVEFPSYVYSSSKESGTSLTYYYKYMNKHPVYENSRKCIINRFSSPNMPLFSAAYFYHTCGTRRGSWYVPSHTELKIIYDNLDKINESRKLLDLPPLIQTNYLTCDEKDENCCGVVDMLDGIYESYFDKTHNTAFAIALINIVNHK